MNGHGAGSNRVHRIGGHEVDTPVWISQYSNLNSAIAESLPYDLNRCASSQVPRLAKAGAFPNGRHRMDFPRERPLHAAIVVPVGPCRYRGSDQGLGALVPKRYF
jgi:hypothetical protein